MYPCGGHQCKERTITVKKIYKRDTVTIDRDTYNTLVAAYKALEATQYAALARSNVPLLTPNELESLDQA